MYKDTRTMNTASANLINATLNSLGDAYSHVARATLNENGRVANNREIGTQLDRIAGGYNEFANALWNRIGRTLISTRSYVNVMRRLKKGTLEYGDTIEDIVIELISVRDFDPDSAFANELKYNKPKILAQLYKVNYEKQYYVSIMRNDIKKAFLTPDGVENLILGIISKINTSMEYDEQIVMKYMIAREYVNGRTTAIAVPELTAVNSDPIITSIKEYNNNMTQMSKKYNHADYRTFCPSENQVIIQTSKFSAVTDVNSLAKAFNLTYANFIAGYSITIDNFVDHDMERLYELFPNSAWFREFTTEEKEALSKLVAVHCDEDWVMVFDNWEETGITPVKSGTYDNYFQTVSKIICTSPFANVITYVNEEPKVLGISLSPQTPTLTSGQYLQFNVNVDTIGGASKDVIYSIAEKPSAGTYITENGLLYVASNETNDKLTILAYSKVEPSFIAETIVTISGVTTNDDEVIGE